MASEYGLELLNKVQRDFAKLYANDSKIKKLTKKIANNSQSYEDANEYAIRVGELASNAITKHINSKDLNYISRELAEDVLKPTLTTDYELISNVVGVIQGNMNKASKIGLQPQIADLDINRIDGLINKIASYDTLEQGEYLLKEPIVNYSQAVVDDSIRKNMDVQTKAGMEPKIVRKAEAPDTKTKTYVKGKRKITRTWTSPCDWCKDLEGTYLYKDVKNTGNEVYQRHEGCRCIITYVNGKKRQDVRTKTEWESDEESARVEAIKKNEERLAREEREKAIDRKERITVTQQFIEQLGFSPKGASIAYNQYKDDILKYGLDKVIDVMRDQARFNIFKRG